MLSIIAAVVAFLGGDMIWLYNTAHIYRRLMPPILAVHPVIWASVGFYAVYLAGLCYFCVVPGRNGSALRAGARGAFYGFVGYAVYDLTNQAVVANWPVSVTVFDMLWGTVLSAFACLVGWAVARR